MTLVGKILVIVIVLFSFAFLGVSTVVFTTATNWKAATDEQKKKVSALQTAKSDADTKNKALENDLATAKTAHDAVKKELENRITALNQDLSRLQTQVTAANGELTVAQQTANTALAEADASRKEAETLRTLKLAVEDQANKYKLREAELNDEIRILARERDVLKKNNEDLRDQSGRKSALLRQHGLSDDISQIKGMEAPPTVSGRVARVDAQNKHVELTIGSDDGLVPGHTLHLYRTKPRPLYLGEIKIISVDPDRAVGAVVGTTIQGQKILEGDIVSSTIHTGPRS